jgi:hypothetical protein
MGSWRRLSSDAREAWIHGLAFAAAAVIGAILVHPLLPLFEAQTDTHYEALGAYLTCIVIIAGSLLAGADAVPVVAPEKNSIVGEISIDGSTPRHILSLRKL